MRTVSAILIGAALFATAAESAHAQRAEADFQNKWFWGGQAGLFFYRTPIESWDAAIDVGAHWLITRRRTALYLALDELIFPTAARSVVANPASPNGFSEVAFDRGRRLQISLMAVPMSTNIQLMFGGGFTIHQVTNAEPVGAFGSETEQQTALRNIDATDTKAFALLAGSAQIWYGRLALFGNYQFMPAGRDFLISGSQHVTTGGLRIAFGAAREDVAVTR